LVSAEIDSPALPRLVIITGMSGGGRRTAAHVMEDLGWFVVDNLPPQLLPQLLTEATREGQPRLAVGIDARTADVFDQLNPMFARVTAMGVRPEVMFLEASDEAIIRRQESVRRPLPLQAGGTLTRAITAERRLLADLRATADIVIDTSNLTTNQLGNRVSHVFGDQPGGGPSVLVMSFGFKNGLPTDADMVLDVRFLPNPYWVPELRPKTGLSMAVRDYVLNGQPAATQFLDNLDALFDTVRDGFMHEGKRALTIAIGCTGGKHRSVAMTEAFAARVRARGLAVNVLHRDLGKE
jgi:UPF0042 nucleotide-binding protein